MLKIAALVPIPSVRIANAVNLLAQHTQGIAKVLHQGFEEPHAARVAAFLFHLIDPADQDTDLACGFIAVQAIANAFCDGLLLVKSKFIVELIFDARTVKQRKETIQDIT